MDVDLLSVIRRWHFREGQSIREISRRTKLSRNTIAKYLASGEVEPAYPKRTTPSKIDDDAETLASWLTRESGRSRKQRRNLRQLYGDLVHLGYRGSYDRVAAFARAWRTRRQEGVKAARGTFVPLVFEPGEAFQFDWSEDWAVIGGERRKLMIAHFKRSYSRAFVLRAYPLQTHEMLFDAHNHALAVLGGVPQRGIYDNMKTAVNRVGRGKIREVNARFQAMASHFLLEATFCSPAAGWELGQIEKNVRDSRSRFWHDAPKFVDLDELNTWLAARCQMLWHEVRHPEQPMRTIAEVWVDEQTALMRMPPPFDGFIEHTKRVSPTCLIAFERNRYRVPAAFANHAVSLRVYANRLVIVAEGSKVVEHPRLFSQGHDRTAQVLYDGRHYLAVVQRKPGALRNGAPFAELPDGFKRLQSTRLKRPGGDREMVEVLALVLHHDEQTVLCAVELALETGAPSKQHVINILNRLLETTAPARIDAPAGLSLIEEPQAHVDRYDHLREVTHAD